MLFRSVLIFDLDNQVYVKNLDLPQIPEPAATVLLDNLRNLHQKKGTFVEASNEPKEKIVRIDKNLGGTLLGVCNTKSKTAFLQFYDFIDQQFHRILL